MSTNAQTLYDMLPAVLRARDHQEHAAVVTPALLDLQDRMVLAGMQKKAAAQSLTPAEAEQLELLKQASMAGPLGNLLALLAEPIAVLQEDLEQLYDDLFVETCADWVAAYIGEIVGYRAQVGGDPTIASPRAEVAHTIANRRRKGTVAVLEQLAFDITRWKASAAEFFQRLIVLQHVNHPRPQCQAAPDLRRWRSLERIGRAFDTTCRTVDVRRIAGRRGRHNIPNIGIFLWRLDAYPLSRSSAARVDDRRFRVHPLGIDHPLYTSPQTEEKVTQLATPLNVPEPISRRVLHQQLDDYYTGSDNAVRSLRLYENSSGTFTAVPREAIRVCNLSDDGPGWANLPQEQTYGVDPVLGRLALPPGLRSGTAVEVDFNYAFSGDIGGGEYERASPVAEPQPLTPVKRVPDDHLTIAAALTALAGQGIVEITDSRRYEEALAIDVVAGATVVLRAANRCRPTLQLSAPMTLSGGELAEVTLEGLLICGAPLHLAEGNGLRRLNINHCTLVPGLSLAPDATPRHPDTASLVANSPTLSVLISRSILGALRTHARTNVVVSQSIIDATAPARPAYCGIDGAGPGGPLTLDACTVVGKLHALTFPLVTNSIVFARLDAGDPWPSPVIAVRRQEGCVRFSFVPEAAQVPRRYRCLPETAAAPELAAPRFSALRYGMPGYGQLSVKAGERLLTGAEDGGQPGAFHFVQQAQRESNLRARLEEYLRAGLEAGIFYSS